MPGPLTRGRAAGREVRSLRMSAGGPNSDPRFAPKECGTAREFMDELCPHKPKFLDAGEGAWIFRGVGAKEHRLVPRALRSETRLLDLESGGPAAVGPPDARTVEEQARLEFATFRAFVRAVDREGLRVPGDASEFRTEMCRHEFGLDDIYGEGPFCHGWPPNRFLPAMALAQHHGVPTRLLDWTYSAFVAAFFAACSALGVRVAPGKQEQTAEVVVWALYCPRFVPVARREREPFLDNLHRLLWRVDMPAYGNARLHAQRGVLTLYDAGLFQQSRLVDVRCLHELRSAVGLDVELARVSLAVEEAPQLLRLLGQHGVTTASMYTGYEGAAREVAEGLS